jgi:hypothetical protein
MRDWLLADQFTVVGMGATVNWLEAGVLSAGG